MKRITSPCNDLCKHVRRLMDSRRYRRECGEFALEGRRLFEDALRSGLKPHKVLLGERLTDGEALDVFEETGGELYVLSQSAMRACGDTVSPQGLVGIFPLPGWSGTDSRRGAGDSRDAGSRRGAGAGLSENLISPFGAQPQNSGAVFETGYPRRSVMLCSLQDPGNVGMIIRTAEAFALPGVLVSADCPDLFSPKVLRATMGGVFRVPVRTVEDVPAAIRALREAGVRIYAAALCEEARPVAEMNFQGDCCVLIGNEGNGLPPLLTALCDGAVLIPMRGQAQSLNAAMAAGIFIYEMMRE